MTALFPYFRRSSMLPEYLLVNLVYLLSYHPDYDDNSDDVSVSEGMPCDYNYSDDVSVSGYHVIPTIAMM